MEGSFVTVEEAASIIGCKRSMVYELIADGWLSRPAGKTKAETGGKVTQKSLYQFVLVDRLSRLPARDLKALKKHRKLFEKSESTKSEANRISIVEGKEKNELSPTHLRTAVPLPIEDSQSPKRCPHHDFAERHQFSFRWGACQLAPDDEALQDDLVQEMSLAVLECNERVDFDFLFGRVLSRAKDYLKYEARRGMVSLDEARFVSDSRAERIASLNLFIESLRQRGVPAEWIEEVIGQRLDVV